MKADGDVPPAPVDEGVGMIGEEVMLMLTLTLLPAALDCDPPLHCP